MVEASPHGSNRRLTARHACHLNVRYSTGKQWHPATAMDLSRSGCRIRLGEDLARGAAVSVALEKVCPDAAAPVSAQVPGVVVWCRLEGLSHQAGIHFQADPPELGRILETVR